jgi:hypothetical protein
MGYAALKCLWFSIPVMQWESNLESKKSEPDFYERLEESIGHIQHAITTHSFYYVKNVISADSNSMTNAALRVIALSHPEIRGGDTSSAYRDYGKDMYNHAIHRLSMRYHELHNGKPITSADSL